jgi:integrase
MAYTISRGERHTGYYKDKAGNRCSAGTFASREEALDQAQIAEKLGVQGSYRVTMTLEQYIKAWLPKADLLPITKKNYKSVLVTHVLPLLGRRKVNSIKRANVREMLETLRQEGIGSATRIQAKSALGSALQDLVEADQLDANPTHKIKIKQLDSNELRNVLEPDEFKDILSHLPSDSSRLFAKFLALTGCRYGEATEVRLKDLNEKSNEVYVQRRVSDLGAKANNGDRFKVIPATKSGHRRLVVVSAELMKELLTHAQAHGVERKDLLFSKSLIASTVDVEKTSANTSNHLPRDTWRRMWRSAIGKSSINWFPRTHDLRHANATLLLKGGIDVHEVKERLGHQSISTTERYLHRLRHQTSKASEIANEFL